MFESGGRFRALVWGGLMATAGCGTHGVAHVAPDESQPHLSWELRSGGTEGDARSVCGSDQSARPCVLTASTDNGRTLATLHVLAHAAAKPTSYLGFVRAPFLEGQAGQRPAEISVTLAPGNRPAGTTILGRVVTVPGAYTLTILMDATQPGDPLPRAIGQKIDVTVSRSASH